MISTLRLRCNSYKIFTFSSLLNMLCLFLKLFLFSLCGVREFKMKIVPRVILMAEGGHYCAEEITPSGSKAMSMARYQRRSYHGERVSRKGLTLT